MNSAEQQLKRIQEKLQQLLKEVTLLRKENSRLKSERDAALDKMAAREKSTDELKQQVSILKVSTGTMNETDKKEFEKRINSYLKEIDRCIALLGE